MTKLPFSGEFKVTCEYGNQEFTQQWTQQELQTKKYIQYVMV